MMNLRYAATAVLAFGLLASAVQAGPRAPLPVAVPWTWTVQINALVAASSADADAISAAPLQMKPKEFIVRRGDVVYEFVGKNEVLPMIREAASMLR